MHPPVPISFYHVLIWVMIFVTVLAVMITSLIVILRKRGSAVKFDAIHISELIKLVVAIGSFLTVCITLILLVLQNRVIVAQTRYALESVESNVFGVLTGQNLASDKLFINNPKLRPYFYSGKELKETDPLYHQVVALAEYLLDYYDGLATQLRKYPAIWRAEKESWEKNLIDMLAWSPILRRYLTINREWYNDDLFALMRVAEKKRQNGATRQSLFK
jgi:hypothetical protein